MALPFNITNPGISFPGLLTSEEQAYVTNLVGLTYVSGDVLYYDGADMTNLGIGTVGQVLTTNTGATAVEWTTIAGGSTPVTTKGDLYGYSTVDARIPVGTNGEVLIADSAEALGVKWGAAGAGDVTAGAVLGDNLLIRGDGAGKGVQNSGITITDADAIEGATIDVDSNTITNAGNMTLARIAGSTYSTLQHLQDVFHSAGVAEGGAFTDDTDGTVSVAAGNGFIRATDSAVAEILYFDWAAEAGANVALTDSDMNYLYVEYNAGSPQVISTITKRTDENTNVFLGTIYREGTDLHMTEATRANVGDHAIKMLVRMRETSPFARVSGGILSELGTRNLALTAGDWWEGLTNFTTAAIDSSVAGTFTRCYQDGIGGFTVETAQTQWNNTQFDDGSGTLATISNAKYGVHWLYLAQDGDMFVLYGTTDGTLTAANDAGVPANTPPQFSENHARLIGKIVFLKSASTVTSIQSVFNGQFSLEAASDHGGLTGLGDDDHSQYILVDGTRAYTGDVDLGGFNLTEAGTLFLKEQAAADVDVVASGQIWVKNTTPNELWFTDDAGTDVQLGIDLSPDSSATVKGIVELATDAETSTGADTARATTPANIASLSYDSVASTSEASSGTPAPTGDSVRNEHYLTALAAAAAFVNPSGTAVNGNSLIIRIKDNATIRALTWGTEYRGLADTLPSTTVASKTMYIGFKYNSADTKWDMVALNSEA